MLRVGNHHLSKSISLLLFVEIMVFIVAVYAGAAIRFHEDLSLTRQYPLFITPALIFTVAMIFSMTALGMYQQQSSLQLRTVFLRLVPAYALGFSIISVVFYVIPAFQLGRGVLGLVFLLSGAGLIVTRVIFLRYSRSNIFDSRVIFLGAGDLARECGELAESRATTGKYTIAGYIPIMINEPKVPASLLLRKQGSLYETALAYKATDIVVARQNKRGVSFPIQELLECKLHGIRVIDSAVFFERETCQIRLNSFQPSWLVFGGGFDQSFTRIFFKRTFDLVVSCMLAIVTLPIMAITTFFIYLEDRGPILYSQERVGRGGEPYMVHKFRSMRINAEKAGKPQWATKNDDRVTKVGGLIRKLRIDELPQIFNVVMGDMSFVGPRPERPFFVKELIAHIPYYDIRHSIKPGITGMAQVRYPYGASVEDAIQKLQYDLYYVKNNSLFLDMMILIDTIQVVLLGKGAR